MKKVKIKKGYAAVIERNGKLIAIKDDKNAILIEAGDNVIITEKTKNALKDEEKLKLK